MVSVVATTAPAVVLPRRRRGVIKDGFAFETVERLGQWTAGCAGSRAGSSVCLEGGRSWPSPGEEVAAETEPGVPFKSTPRAIHALVTRRPFGIARSHDGVFAAARATRETRKKTEETHRKTVSRLSSFPLPRLLPSLGRDGLTVTVIPGTHQRCLAVRSAVRWAAPEVRGPRGDHEATSR